MAWLSDPTLTIDEVEGHPGRRRLRIDVDVVCDPADAADDRTLVIDAAVHAVDRHDAVPEPSRTPILERRRRVEATSHHITIEEIVDRVDLDVEQDWWSSGHGGELEPIAEWLDHLVADLTLSMGRDVVARARSPIVTGSWGALGDD